MADVPNGPCWSVEIVALVADNVTSVTSVVAPALSTDIRTVKGGVGGPKPQ